MYNIISFIGIFAFIGIAFILSESKKNINWKIILWGIALQFMWAAIVFTLPTGTKVFLYLNDIVIEFLKAASSGIQFLFGPLAAPPGTKDSVGFVLAIQGLLTIIFFSAFISILYYYNIMQKIIRFLAKIIVKFMKLSGAESLCAASNLFVGVESLFIVRPNLNSMTRSELSTVLTTGMATVASNVMALYVFTLHKIFPAIAGHLISASVLSIPAAIVMSKIIIPEKETPLTLGKSVKLEYKKENTLFEAIINSAENGVKVVVSISALLIAVLGLVSVLDLFLGFLSNNITNLSGISIKLCLKDILGYIFYPLVVLTGVNFQDVLPVAKIIGERVVMTEVVSYTDLAKAVSDKIITNPRSIVITSYILCGFTHIASLSIFSGALAALAPQKRNEISSVAIKVFISATLATLMTGAVAGLFYYKSSILGN